MWLGLILISGKMKVWKRHEQYSFSVSDKNKFETFISIFLLIESVNY